MRIWRKPPSPSSPSSRSIFLEVACKPRWSIRNTNNENDEWKTATVTKVCEEQQQWQRRTKKQQLRHRYVRKRTNENETWETAIKRSMRSSSNDNDAWEAAARQRCVRSSSKTTMREKQQQDNDAWEAGIMTTIRKRQQLCQRAGNDGIVAFSLEIVPVIADLRVYKLIVE